MGAVNEEQPNQQGVLSSVARELYQQRLKAVHALHFALEEAVYAREKAPGFDL